MTAIAENHSTITGPKSAPTLALPRFWMKKRPSKIAIERGTMAGCAALVTTPSPSTAERTEIDGVMTPSPKSIAAPIATTHTSQPARIGTFKMRGGDASASNARMPPSPS